MEKNVIIHPVAAYTFSYLKNKKISEYRAANAYSCRTSKRF